MNSMQDTKKLNIGIITVAHMRDPSSSVTGIVNECISLVEDLGYSIVYNNRILFDETSVGEYINELKRNSVDAFIVVVTNWLEPPTLIQPLYEFASIPFILWGFPESDDNLDKGLFLGSSSAAAVIKSALEQMDFKFQYIMGLPDNNHTSERVKTALNNIHASVKISRSKIGLVGYNSMGIYTATFDQLGIKKHLGIEIDCRADSFIVTEMMKIFSDDEINEVRQRFCKGYVFGENTEKSFELSIRMYLALKQLVAEGRWEGLSVKCQHEFTSYLKCAACLPLSMLTDEGIVCSDEGDVHAAITMMIMRSMSDGDIFFGDIYPYNHKSFLMGHCGLVPHSCSEPGCDITLNEMDKRISRDGKNTGGIVTTLMYKSGDVTLARIEGRRERGYIMHIVEGAAVPARSVGHNFSNVEINLGNEYNYWDFIEKQLSNHYVLIYDRIAKELRDFCKYKDIKIL